MALDFPNSPSVNDSFSAGGKTWVYNGTKWVLLGVSLNQAVADGAITTAKIADSAITASKIADGTIVAAEIANNAITTAKILDANVTQAKLGTTLSAVTVTTAANRDTAVASPFTGQLVFLTDTKKIQVWDGTSWLNITLAPPETPTSLSATALSTTSVSIAFTAGGANGSPITNYKYATSADNVTYSAYSALDPADTTSPITISGLTAATTYYFKLKAVNDMGDSVASAAVTVTTLNTVTVDYLVVAGGGGGGGGVEVGGHRVGGGGGGGGLRSTVTASGGSPGTVESALTLVVATNYGVTVGAGGAGGLHQTIGTNGESSIFSTITSVGGGGGGQNPSGAGGAAANGALGGSGGGSATNATAGGAGTANQGYAGGNGGASNNGGGGGGAGAVGQVGQANDTGGSGGNGVASSITGSSVTRGGGGGGGGYGDGSTFGGGAGGSGGGGAGAFANVNGTAGTSNLGGGGGGAGADIPTNTIGGAGGSGVVILRYLSAYTITLGAGLTGTTATVSSNKVTTITAGSGNVSWA